MRSLVGLDEESVALVTDVLSECFYAPLRISSSGNKTVGWPPKVFEAAKFAAGHPSVCRRRFPKSVDGDSQYDIRGARHTDGGVRESDRELVRQPPQEMVVRLAARRGSD